MKSVLIIIPLVACSLFLLCCFSLVLFSIFRGENAKTAYAELGGYISKEKAILIELFNSFCLASLYSLNGQRNFIFWLLLILIANQDMLIMKIPVEMLCGMFLIIIWSSEVSIQGLAAFVVILLCCLTINWLFQKIIRHDLIIISEADAVLCGLMGLRFGLFFGILMFSVFLILYGAVGFLLLRVFKNQKFLLPLAPLVLTASIIIEALTVHSAFSDMLSLGFTLG